MVNLSSGGTSVAQVNHTRARDFAHHVPLAGGDCPAGCEQGFFDLKVLGQIQFKEMRLLRPVEAK